MSDYSIAEVYEFYEANVRDAVSGIQAASDSIPMEFLVPIVSSLTTAEFSFGLCSQQLNKQRQNLGKNIKKAN